MREKEAGDMPSRWLPLWPRSSRILRAPHILALVIISTLLILASRSAARFAQDGTFKISIFEDLHFGEDESTDWAPRQDVNSLKVMRTILDTEGPQLVVLNGDLVTGEDTMLENATDYLNMIVEPLISRNCLWASTYGNHDQSFNLSTEAMLAVERTYPNSLTNSMVEGDGVGVTNYFIHVWGAPGDDVPSVILWFFDSQGGREFLQHDDKGDQIVVPGTVHPLVTKWFLSTSAAIEAQFGKPIPSLAFVHIPTSAMSKFQNQGVDPHHEPGLNDDNPLGPQSNDAEFVNALLGTEGLLAVFSGHDHGNDFCHPSPSSSNTPFFCFGRHTGYGGYGHWMRGSRQVVLKRFTLDAYLPDVETWVRLEDGSVSGHVVLNETYGIDWYPKVEHKETMLPPGK
jgi:Calcineurin-like phosphoesterase